MDKREIIFDIETTGFRPEEGHMIVEIGAIEMVNGLPSGGYYHQYVNPERIIPEEVIKIHGITNEFVKDKPILAVIVDDFLEFIADSTLVAHNAKFDVNFLNYHLSNLGYRKINFDNVVDTLDLAKKIFPNKRNSLDHLCERYSIDKSKRTYHGALLDSQLLAEVYIELLGGRQKNLLGEKSNNINVNSLEFISGINRRSFPSRKFSLSENESLEHQNFLLKFMKRSIWGDIG